MTTYTRLLLAHSHAAMHRTELLMLQCRAWPLQASPHAQGDWHARQQAAFLAWLDAGGFAAVPEEQVEATIGNSGRRPLFPAPDPDAGEESQFSQNRPHVAVK